MSVQTEKRRGRPALPPDKRHARVVTFHATEATWREIARAMAETGATVSRSTYINRVVERWAANRARRRERNARRTR